MGWKMCVAVRRCVLYLHYSDHTTECWTLILTPFLSYFILSDSTHASTRDRDILPPN